MNTVATLVNTPAPAGRLSEKLGHAPFLLRDVETLQGLVESHHQQAKPTTLEDALGLLMSMIVIRLMNQELGRRAPGLSLTSEFWAAMVGLGGSLAETAMSAMQAKLAQIEAIAGPDPQAIAAAVLAWSAAPSTPETAAAGVKS